MLQELFLETEPETGIEESCLICKNYQECIFFHDPSEVFELHLDKKCNDFELW